MILITPKAKKSEEKSEAMEQSMPEKKCCGCGVAMCDKVHPYLFAIARIVVGLLFFTHGAMKFGWIGGKAVPLMSLFGLAGAIEVVVGVLVVIGLWTRWAAIVAAVEMLIAYFYAHAPKSMFPWANGGELALMYFAVFLFLHVKGSGKWSVDACCKDGSCCKTK